MSIRLRIVSLSSRLFFKPALARIRNLQRLRSYLDFVMKLNSMNPKGAIYEKGVLSHNNQTVPVVWTNLANPSQSHVLLYIHGGGFIFGSAACLSSETSASSELCASCQSKSSVGPNASTSPLLPLPMCHLWDFCP